MFNVIVTTFFCYDVQNLVYYVINKLNNLNVLYILFNVLNLNYLKFDLIYKINNIIKKNFLIKILF